MLSRHPDVSMTWLGKSARHRPSKSSPSSEAARESTSTVFRNAFANLLIVLPNRLRETIKVRSRLDERLLVQEQRPAAVRRELSHALAGLGDDREDADNVVLRARIREALGTALGELSDQEMQFLLLRYSEE